jgi:hypothetical protein
MAAESLRTVRDRLQSDGSGLDADARKAFVARVDDLIDAIDQADRALSKLPHPSVADAAAKMAHLFYASGRGWQRYVAESTLSSGLADELRAAVRSSADPILGYLGRMLGQREIAHVTQRGDGAYGLPCAACGADAVTLSLTRPSPGVAQQLVVSSLSPVTVFRPMTGPRMSDVIKLLDAGDVETVVRHLRETQPGGCDAWCDQCGRLYCKTHFAIEAQWTGSWHEATYATCPLGHEHEID